MITKTSVMIAALFLLASSTAYAPQRTIERPLIMPPMIKLKQEVIQAKPEKPKIELPEAKIMNVTGYTCGYESTQKKKGESGYCTTFSGEQAKRGITIAAGKNIEIGTRIYIPYFKDWANKGLFTVQDRGGAIKENHIDVFFGETALKEARSFGRQDLTVYILGKEGENIEEKLRVLGESY